NRAYARVLPTEESIGLCIDAGFKKERIIRAKPPFSKEENGALIREKNIKYLVTKRTGKSGGFMEKVEAARENGAECIIINRPTEETGLTVEETQREILKLI
ncbi:MAG: precorrin-6A/cobalt-precorrin-6A reductase, partial [Clostridia bacterium]|nr:precorrin-6A/cobalt-precorrin-6A reductase [Clostridia bacterium]